MPRNQPPSSQCRCRKLSENRRKRPKSPNSLLNLSSNPRPNLRRVASESVAESVSEPAAESVVESVAESVVEFPADPVLEPAAESVVESHSESVAEPAAESAAAPAPSVDAEQTSAQEAPAKAEAHSAPGTQPIAPTLFELEEETVRHRHKQRVIMSLYNTEPAAPAPKPASVPALEPTGKPVAGGSLRPKRRSHNRRWPVPRHPVPQRPTLHRPELPPPESPFPTQLPEPPFLQLHLRRP